MLAFLFLLAAPIIDSKQGSLEASQGALLRVLEPSLYDAFFPIFAFTMVIVLPSFIALWVIYRTWAK